jgi:hypothetical protein
MQTVTYKLPAYWASALINDDYVRKLTSTELRRLESGQTISYRRQSNPKARATIDPNTLDAIRTALVFISQGESLRAAFQLRQALAEAGESK